MMYRYLSILFSLKVSAGIFILLSGCVDTDTDINTFSFPPEWAVQEAVWTDFASERVFIPNQGAKLKIIAALSRHIATKVVYDSDSLKQLALNELPRMEADLANISFVKTSSPMNWIRDPGPMFITNGNQLKVLDFGWNCYGHAYDCDGDLRGEVDVELAYGLGLEIEPVDLYLEGGGIEVSNNTMIAYKAMALQRNPDKSIEEVTDILLRAFGKDQIIWLDEFPLIDKPWHKVDNFFGQGANGHIDVTTRFLNDSTILATIISESDKDKSELLAEDHRILNHNLTQLKQAKRPNGKPYHIVTIEAPDYSLFEYETTMSESYWHALPSDTRSLFSIGDTIRYVPALEYANFCITNGAILLSSYWKEGMPDSERQKEDRVRSVLQAHFPGRQIVPLDVLPINWGGGGIHCRTQQQPKLQGE